MKDKLRNFETEIAGLLMMAILVVLCLQIVTRYVFNSPLAWTEEVARHLFIWLVFFGASGAIANRSHVVVDVLLNALPRRARIAAAVGSHLLVLFFLGNLFYWGALSVQRMWDIPTATLELPQGLVYAVFPITAFCMIARTLVALVEDARGTADDALSAASIRSID
ncbi:TRAP transporter small permease [Bosea sp. PAMC 26642]|uniref:TRAP transporter small permease n=1 Tax=Bosea sp. (strain PAMC 26642) TaxID=1792307 RepID=UPI00077067A6|nr:TRAP transporter small permease [Bosea sp. PAMC 26642]AMJ61527.1 hypothetical protein AXW83_15540 [Bosea sp. PAMC 26642]